jgi:hypothetical protein
MGEDRPPPNHEGDIMKLSYVLSGLTKVITVNVREHGDSDLAFSIESGAFYAAVDLEFVDHVIAEFTNARREFLGENDWSNEPPTETPDPDGDDTIESLIHEGRE